MNRVNSKYLKLLRFMTGVYPVIHTGSYFIDSLLALSGSGGLYPYYCIMDISFMFSIILFALSNIFRFCMWHRLLVINMMICSMIDYIYELDCYPIDGYVIVYSILSSSMLFFLGSIISLFFKNKEVNNEKQRINN